MYILVIFILSVLLFILLLVPTCIVIYIFLHFVVLIICNTCLLFACLHVEHDVTNASLYLCLSIEEATEMAAKYLHNKKCVFNNFEKYRTLLLQRLRRRYIYIYIYI